VIRCLLIALALLLAPLEARAQVAFDAKSSTDLSATAGTSMSSAANISVGSGSNRALVVCVLWDVQTISGVSVTWNGAALSQVAGAVANSGSTHGRAAIFAMVNPASGSNTLSASWTTSSDAYMYAVSYTGVDQTGGATSFPHGTSATGTIAAGGSGNSSVSVTSATNNAVQACHSHDQGNIGTTNQTQLFVDNALTTDAAANRAAGAASVSMTAAESGSGLTDNWVAVGTDILAASGGGGGGACGTVSSRMLMGVGC
jgi:hypothetical protein